MIIKLKTLDRLLIRLLKVGPVARTSKYQFWLACFLASSGSLIADDGLINGYIGAQTNQLNRDVGDVPGNRFNGNLGFDFQKNRSDSQINQIERRFTASALMNDQSLLMYSVQEAYVGGHLTNKDTIRFGRQILDWSTLDATWGFGKLNNRRNFDFFEPGQEGLTGLNYERKSANGMRYKFFASGLYIPELNPAFDINDNRGTIKSRHPWSDVPASSAMANGSTLPINYDVNIPSYARIVYRYSVGANIGFENKHWVFDNFIMRKPENGLSTKVTVDVDTFQNIINAKIVPQVYYHDIYGSTLKYRNEDIGMYVSAMAVRPNTFPDGSRQATQYTDIKTEKRREDYMGGGISRINSLYGYGFNYVARLSPFDRQKEQLALDPRWNQALNFFGLYNFGSKLTVSADLKFDMLTTDRLIMARAFYNVTRNFLVNVGMNLIGTPEDGKSFWSPYTNNDSLYAGLRYIF